MRFLTSFPEERKAYACANYFTEQGIHAMYESAGGTYSLWIVDEDDVERAQLALDKFEALGPEERARLEKPKALPVPKIAPQTPLKGGRPELRVRLAQIEMRKKPVPHPLTHILIALCAILFIWNSLQESKLIKDEGSLAAEIGLTPLQKDLLFDYPSCYGVLEETMNKYPLKSFSEIQTQSPEVQQAYAAAEHCPAWKGFMAIFLKEGSIQAPMFEKLRKGEIWRIFTPTLLHRDFLHILFNMAWLLILGKMIEERAGKFRMIFLTLIVGIVSNFAQYLMGGPYFLGFSGVIVGMAGFIWMRQKLSPWEGYPLSQGTLLFLFLFVIAMVALEVISLSLQAFGIQGIIGNIANTAHIVGGLTGLLLGRIPLFSRSPS